MSSEQDDAIRAALNSDVVAVIGCSSTPGKDAHEIPKYAREQGYEVIPVNPYADEIFGDRVYDSLSDVSATIDVVNVFRPSEEVDDIVDAVLDRDDVDVLWTQLGIQNENAAERAREAGIAVVQDRCFKVEHSRQV